NRPRGRAAWEPFLSSRTSCRQKCAVSDEYEIGGRWRAAAADRDPLQPVGREEHYVLHHQEAHSPQGLPQRRRGNSRTAIARRDDAGGVAGADCRAAENEVRRRFLPAWHGSWPLATTGRGRPYRQVAIHSRVTGTGEGSDRGAERAVVEVGRASRG